MGTTDKIIIASSEEVDSLKLFVLGLEKKQFKTDYEEKMFESAKFKLSALGENKIIFK